MFPANDQSPAAARIARAQRWAALLVDETLLPEEPQAVLPDPSLDRFARLVKTMLRTPTALVTIVEPDRQVFPGAAGLTPEMDRIRETPLEYSFCKHVVGASAPLVVPDARVDPRLSDNPSVRSNGVVGYAGFPVSDGQGTVVGSLCAFDTVRRDWTESELATLRDLAAACSTEIGLRQLRRQAAVSARAEADSSRRLRALLALTQRLGAARSVHDVARVLLRVLVTDLDCLHAGIWVIEPDDPKTLRYVQDPDISWPQAAQFDFVPIDDRSPLGATVMTGEPRFYGDRAGQKREFPPLDYSDVAEDGAARTFLPLMAEDDPVGVLVVLWPEHREFTDDDQMVISVIASSTASAVQRVIAQADARGREDRVDS